MFTHLYELVKKCFNPKTYMTFQKYWVRAHTVTRRSSRCYADIQTFIQLSCGCLCDCSLTLFVIVALKNNVDNN